MCVCVCVRVCVRACVCVLVFVFVFLMVPCHHAWHRVSLYTLLLVSLYTLLLVSLYTLLLLSLYTLLLVSLYTLLLVSLYTLLLAHISLPRAHAPHVYVRSTTLRCFHSLISTQSFRRLNKYIMDPADIKAAHKKIISKLPGLRSGPDKNYCVLVLM